MRTYVLKTYVFLFALCLTSLSFAVHAEKIYRWVDKDGQVHYGNQPDEQSLNVEERKLRDQIEQSQDLPYAVRRAQQNFPVTLYTSAECDSTCKQAKQLLKTLSIPYTDTIIKTREDVEMLKKLTTPVGSPMIQIGKKFIVGLQPETWKSELDIAGYPINAGLNKVP